jgi:hypothetical protein
MQEGNKMNRATNNDLTNKVTPAVTCKMVEHQNKLLREALSMVLSAANADTVNNITPRMQTALGNAELVLEAQK